MWMNRLKTEMPEEVRNIIEAEIEEAMQAGHDFTRLRPLLTQEAFLTLPICTNWQMAENEKKLKMCNNQVTKVRYSTHKTSCGMPSYLCEECSPKFKNVMIQPW